MTLTTKKDKTQLISNEIIAVLSQLYGAPLTYRQIASRIKQHSFKNPKDYIPLLEQLVKQHVIQKSGRNKYHKPYTSAEIIGRIDIKKTGEGVVYAEHFPEEIIVESGMQNRALQGDLVKVDILAKKGKRVKGEVVKIIERNKSHYAGKLQVYKDIVFLVTDDRKMHKDIFIINHPANLKDWHGKKALVKIIDWPDGAKNPIGEVTKILGNPGENDTEMNAIVTEFGFLTDFPENVLAEADSLPEQLNEKDIKQRVDMRKTTTFTIDPLTAKDFDDALSFRTISDDLFEIGIHIADVSHYVKPGTALDIEAFKRGTSVYLVDRTIPMLPPKLSENLCSLLPNADRPAMSAIFQIDSGAKVKKVTFHKTIIHSIKRFTYEEAQEVLDQKIPHPLFHELQTLNHIARKLRNKRFNEGSMSFESREFYFELDDKGKPTGIKVKERSDSHFLVEEFMLLANKYVAAHGQKLFENNKHPFVFRFHDQPNEVKLDEFKSFAQKWGYNLKTQIPQQVKKSINDLLHKVKGKPEEGVLSQLAIRTMAKATYTPYQSSHFGLGFTTYTHFTSPIRRYPDLMVHRMLFDSLQHKKPETHISEIEAQCKHSSSMEQKASEAERASIKYKQAEWMQQSIGKSFEGIITGVTDWGIFVEINENKCEGLVKLSWLKDDMYDLDEYHMQLVGRYYNKKYALGDPVIVKVKEANPLSRTIDFLMEKNLSSTYHQPKKSKK
jgi:ribonuclease R